MKIYQVISRNLNLLVNLGLKSNQAVNLREVTFEAVQPTIGSNTLLLERKNIRIIKIVFDYQKSNLVTVPKKANY